MRLRARALAEVISFGIFIFLFFQPKVDRAEKMS